MENFQELITAVMVDGLTTCRVQLPFWLQQSLINGILWNDMFWATVVSEHL